MHPAPVPAPYTQVRLCDWLPPDFGAIGQLSIQFARKEALAGQHVLLIGLSSSGASQETEQFESGSVTILRLHMPPLDKTSHVRRLIWTARANLRLLKAAWPHLRRASELHFTGSPPFLLHFIVPANLVWRTSLTYMISDFYPECVMATKARPSWAMRAFHALTCSLRRRVDRFEALGFDQKRHLSAIGIPETRIRIRRDLFPVEIGPDTQPLPRPASSQGKALLLYSGNYGVAHEVETFVEGYIRHHRTGSGRTLLWLNAVGTGADAVEERLSEAGVPLIRSRLVELEEVPRLLVTPDAHLIALKDSFVG